MLTVTKEGEIIGDYWEGIRKVESTRASLVVAEKEKRQAEDYKKAIEAMELAKQKKKKKRTKKIKDIEKPRKKRLYDLYGDEVFRLFREEEMSYMQITKVLGISKESVRLILKEKEAEKWHRAQSAWES